VKGSKKERLTSAKKDEGDKRKETKELMTRFGVVETKQNTKIMAQIEFLNKISDKMIERVVKTTPDEVGLFDWEANKPKKQNGAARPRIFSAKLPNEKIHMKNDNKIRQADIKLQEKNQSPTLPKESILDIPEVKSARFEGEIKVRGLSVGEFQSFYNQTLRKAPQNAKPLKSKLNIKNCSNSSVPLHTMPSYTNPPKETKAHERLISSRGSYKRNLFISTMPTEPSTGSKIDLESLNNLQIFSPKLEHEPIEDLPDIKSATSLSFIPSFIDKEFRTTLVRPSSTKNVTFAPNFNGKRDNRPVFVSKESSKKKGKKSNMSESALHLHKVKAWRDKIFRKTIKPNGTIMVPEGHFFSSGKKIC